MSSYLAGPRAGHLVQVLHIFSFLKCNQCMDICYDPTKLNITEPTTLPQEQAAHRSKIICTMYPDAIEDLPSSYPVHLGKSVQINAFVDADLTGELITLRSQTGVLIFLNTPPTVLYSKRKNTVEVSTYGSEFVAMRVLVEMIIALRYKFHLFGVPIDGPWNVFCDSDDVLELL